MSKELSEWATVDRPELFDQDACLACYSRRAVTRCRAAKGTANDGSWSRVIMAS
jgi:hypothetical protein